MRRIQILYGIGCFLITACNFNNQDKENQSQVPDTHTEQTGQQENAISEEDFLIQNKAAGRFQVGKPIPTSLENFSIRQEQKTRYTEEGPTEETVVVVMKDQEEILHMLPAVDYDTGETTRNIGELRLFSSNYKTPEGIGIGSSLEEFIAQYPNYKIWYTYVSDRYVVEAEEVDAQFLLKKEDFVGDKQVTSAMTPLTKEDFKEGAGISWIRIIP